MKADKSGCVENCKTDDSSYLSNNATICVLSCFLSDNMRFGDISGETCVDACATD